MRMIRSFVKITVLVSSLALLTDAPMRAQAPAVDRIDIVEYGTYTVDRRVQGRDARGINQATATNVQHATTTKEIPARIGTTFGLRYKIIGKPDEAPITLRRIVVFYTLEDSFELVPGIWVIEIWYGNRKLASQSFTVSKADNSSHPIPPSSSEGL
jgi:hypothetical protein